MPQQYDVRPFQIDHIRAQKHGGRTAEANLALSCLPCNAYKGPNVAGHDSDTDQLVRLFNPRTDAWSDHFEWNGPTLVGRTPIGRTTIAVLNINAPERAEHRRLLVEAGILVPKGP
jgi:hypothetical protein